jgi:hypothetical protein
MKNFEMFRDYLINKQHLLENAFSRFPSDISHGRKELIDEIIGMLDFFEGLEQGDSQEETE